jgi:hypothetical protein
MTSKNRAETGDRLAYASHVMAPAAKPLIAVAALLLMNACRGREQLLSDQEKALTSLRATTVAIGEAWLAGDVSSTYARTALLATRDLLSKRHVTLAAASPDILADPAAQSLSASENDLTRSLALLWKGVDEGDSRAVRDQLSAVASHAGRR